MESTPVNQTSPSVLISVLCNAMKDLPQDKSIGLLIVHIENFDRLVSAFGHRMGGNLISTLATRLRETIRARDVAMRISDSKFAVIVNGAHNDGHLMLAAGKMSQTLEQPVTLGDHNVAAASRCGMAMSPQHTTSAEELLQHAETALLAAVENNTAYELYSKEKSNDIADALGLEIELDLAIARGEFELHYQPKISTESLTPCGAEALIRWHNPNRGLISPDIFIPMADRTGRIEPITRFVLNSALREAADWPTHWGELSVAINVTPTVIDQVDLPGMILGALGMWGAEAARLFVEITEGAIMANPEASLQVLKELRDLDVHVSIDDFGTGYSSLAYFKNIPADELKIDKSFVVNMLEDAGDEQIVRAVIELARSFGLAVTAEGVEDAKTASALGSLGCDRLQGYYYSRPLPQQAFIAWLDDFAQTPVADNSRS
ncbi:MAG: EAL domain-containing protein [Gammaproteobacteria bacterium]|nr:EAL domain-containing protein [Gammaproteobacteria bacterium]MDH3507973.1 EAL domain-containing protein [Gammaproteobacteria bacterium]